MADNMNSNHMNSGNRNFYQRGTNTGRDNKIFKPVPAPRINISGAKIEGQLFSERAQEAAKACAAEALAAKKKVKFAKEVNKPAQLRRFYDELVMWHDKVFAKQTQQERQEEFLKFLPYIQMLRAKAAYAKGRTRINETFYGMFDNLIEQVNSPEHLKRARLFMEALLGYLKYYGV